jgi:hypothetical protein
MTPLTLTRNIKQFRLALLKIEENIFSDWLTCVKLRVGSRKTLSTFFIHDAAVQRKQQKSVDTGESL